MDPLTARRTWRTPEMIHGLIYFAPEATEAYAALGVGKLGDRVGEGLVQVGLLL